MVLRCGVCPTCIVVAGDRGWSRCVSLYNSEGKVAWRHHNDSPTHPITSASAVVSDRTELCSFCNESK